MVLENPPEAGDAAARLRSAALPEQCAVLLCQLRRLHLKMKQVFREGRQDMSGSEPGVPRSPSAALSCCAVSTWKTYGT
jgi:hypothetical protein